MFVLDTNILSELMKPSPNQKVMDWIARHPKMSLFTTSITEAEILYGLSIIEKGNRKSALMNAATKIFTEDLKGRVIPFDSQAASFFASISASRKLIGQPISQFDAQIAAISKSRAASLVTRNKKDFDDCGIIVINPWEDKE
ncbi:MAG: type II toxin-antitoxin system VapC family toxin [Balneolaceae bacterium]